MADKYWIADSVSNANTAGNWSPSGVPVDGDNIFFNGAHVGSCNWDIGGSYGAFQVLTGYTGTITQQASFTIASYLQQAGTFTGDPSYPITCAGNWTKTGGTLTDWRIKLYMTGENSELSMNTPFNQKGLAANANIQVSSDVLIDGGAGSFLTVASGKTLTIASGKYVDKRLLLTSLPGDFTNSGTIAGTGTLYIGLQNADKSITFGEINCPLIIKNAANVVNLVLTTVTDILLGSSLSVFSDSATYTITLNLNGHDLTVTGITIGVLGIIDAGSSTITNSGNWDSSAGTFNQGKSTVNLTGATKTLKTAGLTQPFHNLTIPGTYTLQSNLKVLGKFAPNG